MKRPVWCSENTWQLLQVIACLEGYAGELVLWVLESDGSPNQYYGDMRVYAVDLREGE